MLEFLDFRARFWFWTALLFPDFPSLELTFLPRLASVHSTFNRLNLLWQCCLYVWPYAENHYCMPFIQLDEVILSGEAKICQVGHNVSLWSNRYRSRSLCGHFDAGSIVISPQNSMQLTVSSRIWNQTRLVAIRNGCDLMSYFYKSTVNWHYNGSSSTDRADIGKVN